MSSWDKYQVQEPNARRALLGGLIATVVLTGLMYAAPAAGAGVWNIPNMIAKAISFDQPMITGSAYWVWGLVIYIAFVVFALPACYAYWVYSYTPGPAWMRGLTYGGFLWLLVEIVVMPLIGQGAFDRKGPAPAAEILSQLILWLIYGLILGLIAGPQEVWRQRPHSEGHA